MNAFPEIEGPHWEHFRYLAGVGVRGFGESLNQSFEEAARAFTALVIDPAEVQPLEAVELGCQGDNCSQLLQNWLELLVKAMNARQALFSHFEVEIEGSRLRATAWGEPIDLMRHKGLSFPSQVLADRLWVGQRYDGQWCAQCTVKA